MLLRGIVPRMYFDYGSPQSSRLRKLVHRQEICSRIQVQNSNAMDLGRVLRACDHVLGHVVVP